MTVNQCSVLPSEMKMFSFYSNSESLATFIEPARYCDTAERGISHLCSYYSHLCSYYLGNKQKVGLLLVNATRQRDLNPPKLMIFMF